MKHRTRYSSRWLLLAALVAIGVGVATDAPSAEEASGDENSAEERAAAEAPTPPSCDPLAGVDRLELEPGTLLLFGELHGTAEAPALFADVACRASQRGVSVRVGLELPHQDTAAIETYLASDGWEDDREALLSGPFWQREYQDGRSSRAMADLLEELRVLASTGLPLGVTLFDSNEPAASGQARDRAMAERLARVAESHPAEVLLVLTGNLHARLGRGTPFDPDYEPLGHLLRRALPDRRILAFDFSSTGGIAWTCTSGKAEDCRARSLGGRGEGSERRLTVSDEPDEHGFHGTYHVGAMTASPPAVGSESEDVSSATVAGDSQVRHIVLCWLKEPGSEAARRKLIEATEALGDLPGVVAVAAGVPLGSDRPVVDDSFDVGIVFTFEDTEALAAYQVHPRHREAVEKVLQPLVERIVVYDFRPMR